VVVAYSGGVDSTFLLSAAKNVLGDNVIAVTIDSPALPRFELEDSIKICEQLKVRQIIIVETTIEEAVKHNL